MNDDEGGGEKIIPGQQNGNGSEKDGDKVEIHLDDDQDEKEKGSSVGGSPAKEATVTTA